MRTSNQKNSIRDLRDGDWYWIDKALLYNYGKKLRASGMIIYNALAFFANFRTQTCFPTQEDIAKLTGLSRRTVIRKVKLLRQLGLIKVERRKGRCIYHLLEVKDVTKRTQPCDRNGTSSVTEGNTNNNYITRINNNIDRDYKKSLNSKASKRFRPKNKEELLALDLAEALGDQENLSLYLTYAKKCPESILRKILGEVKEVPQEKIKKSRAALFTYLIKKYAQSKTKN